MAEVNIHSDFGAHKNKVCHCFHCIPIYFPWSDWSGCHDLSFWMLSFKPAFSLSSFTFIMRLFSSSSLSAVRVVSSAYLRLLIFLRIILIPLCGSSRTEFHMMYSACKLNKQGDNVQPWHTPFPIWKQSTVPCPVLPVASSKKRDSSRKTSISALLTMPKPLTVWITTNCGKFLKRWDYQTTIPASWETCMQVRKQQLELDMKQQTVSKLGKEYVKAVYCHPAYLTYMPSTSWETLGWMKHKL